MQWATVGASYRGRFAPSPTGPLHAGSLVAALGSWLDARAHQGQWLVRIEDVDTPRCVPGAAEEILRQLAALGLHTDMSPSYQSERGEHYATALQQLVDKQLAYRCNCSRKKIEAALIESGRSRTAGSELVYPGTCRNRQNSSPARAAAWRLRTDGPGTTWHDRRLGAQMQHVETEVGDFPLLRADGLWTYQLAVVVDDAFEGITHVVRGADLADNTPRQILLQRALALPQPQYLHLPVVMAADGRKLSKQNGAQALDLRDPGKALQRAAEHLGLQIDGGNVKECLEACLAQWIAKYHQPL
jgi:glutamyl-Q tRNA(Asp) synthetase